MDHYHAVRLKMQRRTLAFLLKHDAVWRGIAAFNDAVNRVKTTLEGVDAAIEQQQCSTTAMTGNKAVARAALEERIFVLAEQLAALAERTHNAELAARVDRTRGEIHRLKNEVLLKFAEEVATIASENLAALKGYSVTEADIEAMTVARAAFGRLKTALSDALNKRAAATRAILELLDRTQRIFKKEIDRMVTKTKESYPDFYAGYFVARSFTDADKGAPVRSKRTTESPKTASHLPVEKRERKHSGHKAPARIHPQLEVARENITDFAG